MEYYPLHFQVALKKTIAKDHKSGQKTGNM